MTARDMARAKERLALQINQEARQNPKFLNRFQYGNFGNTGQFGLTPLPLP